MIHLPHPAVDAVLVLEKYFGAEIHAAPDVRVFTVYAYLVDELIGIFPPFAADAVSALSDVKMPPICVLAPPVGEHLVIGNLKADMPVKLWCYIIDPSLF